jgi:hypothetical protein
MDMIKERILKATTSCQRALDNLENGNKRKTLGDLDYAHDRIIAAKMILINEIKDEEGGL